MKKIVSFLFIFLIACAFNASAAKVRSFYLTQGTFNGAEALTGCVVGYHMASIWEIFDFSNLQYNSTLGLTHADSGFGPPSGNFEDTSGWIRTGGFATQSNEPGTNCLAWQTDDSNVQGTAVFLRGNWPVIGSTSIIDPWASGIAPCSNELRVWCVQD